MKKGIKINISLKKIKLIVEKRYNKIKQLKQKKKKR